MRILMNFGSNGAGLAIWRVIPATVKYPIIFGFGVLCMAEINTMVNESLRAPQITGGEAAKGGAQIDDPVKTREELDAGLPVTGADGLVAVKVGQADAEARTKQAQATADTESMEEIAAKKESGAPLTTTEDIAYSKVQTKDAELSVKQSEARAKNAEAVQREAEATAAREKAKAKIASADFVVRQFGELPNGNGDYARRAADQTLKQVLGTRQ